MKKLIVFAISATLSGAAFAGGFENLKSNLNLTPLNTETITNAGFIIPTAPQKLDIAITKNENKNSGYSYQSDEVCRNDSGKKGYNTITINELKNNPQKGECADLRNADLKYSDLSDANLKGANLSKADLSESKLRRANLSGADLSFVDLHKTTLYRAIINNANLKGASLINAYLRESNLSNSNLKDADLTEVDLCGAYMTDTNLRGTILTDTLLRETDLNGSRYNDMTHLPFSEDDAYQRGMIRVAN